MLIMRGEIKVRYQEEVHSHLLLEPKCFHLEEHMFRLLMLGMCHLLSNTGVTLGLLDYAVPGTSQRLTDGREVMDIFDGEIEV